MQTCHASHPSPSTSEHLFARLTHWFQQTADHLWDHLTSAEALQIQRFQDRHGNSYWSAYDPVSGRCTTVASETELLAWIERDEPGDEPWPNPVRIPLYPLSNRFSPDLYARKQ